MSNHVLTDEEMFCLEGCRSYEQYFHMHQQFETGYCPFCTVDRALNKVLFEDQFAQCWAVPEQFLRKELKYHLIITPKRHVRFEWGLDTDEWRSIRTMHVFLAGQFDLEGGITVTRFGDMRLNAGTVPHLHTNIMVPNGTGEVRIPVFKDPKDREENRARAADFAARYEADKT
jgi:diadenosine tetraphosphate (Ap4A) HIT family hydrolase